MPLGFDAVLERLSRQLQRPSEEIMREGLRAYLERELGQVEEGLRRLRGRYGVTSVQAMEARYQEGTLPEASTWRDLQEWDRLEYQRDLLKELLSDFE